MCFLSCDLKEQQRAKHTLSISFRIFMWIWWGRCKPQSDRSIYHYTNFNTIESQDLGLGSVSPQTSVANHQKPLLHSQGSPLAKRKVWVRTDFREVSHNKEAICVEGLCCNWHITTAGPPVTLPWKNKKSRNFFSQPAAATHSLITSAWVPIPLSLQQV